jgi:hypothetical protein
MSFRTLDVASGANGGAIKLLDDPKRARNIHVTVTNPTALTHAVFFANSRRELTDDPINGISGFAIIAIANNVITSTLGSVAFTSFILQGWVGELWAAADVANVCGVNVFEGAGPDK